MTRVKANGGWTEDKKFNPAKYVRTAAETNQDRIDYHTFLKENSFASVPFHIRGLEEIVPPHLPGELAIYLARSHHGKSTALRDAVFKVQKAIEGQEKVIVGLVSLEDTSEATASKQIRKYGGDILSYSDDQFVFIGNSFGMSIEDMDKLTITNTILTLDYARKEKFAEVMRYAYIGIDYAQLFPVDTEDEKYIQEQVRLQAVSNVKRVFHAAKYFKCPIALAAQANMKDQKSNYTRKMLIPGAADIQESAAYYQTPDIVYSYWQPKHDHPIGSEVEEGPWKFTVEPNLGFVRIVKRRNAEEMGFVGKKDVVGRIFPFWIEEDGSFTYDKKRHQSMVITSQAEKRNEL